MLAILGELKKCVVFLGKQGTDGKPAFTATGSLFEFNRIFHLVTAKHVVVDSRTGKRVDDGLNAYFNSRTPNQIMVRSIETIRNQINVDWTFHPNPQVDIAIIPFGLNPTTDDVKTIPPMIFLAPSQLEELHDMFFLSYQPGIEPTQKVVPIIRTGTVSIINDDATFYLDAFAFPGNSGSPVFVKPVPARIQGGGVAIGDPLGGKFAGMVGEYLPYSELAISVQTGRPRVVFEENTGLAKVWPIQFINQIVSSASFVQQCERLAPRIAPTQEPSTGSEQTQEGSSPTGGHPG